jgi:hypothetical protein
MCIGHGESWAARAASGARLPFPPDEVGDPVCTVRALLLAPHYDGTRTTPRILDASPRIRAPN